MTTKLIEVNYFVIPIEVSVENSEPLEIEFYTIPIEIECQSNQ